MSTTRRAAATLPPTACVPERIPAASETAGERALRLAAWDRVMTWLLDAAEEHIRQERARGV